MSTHSQKELMADRSMDTTQVQLSGPMSSIGVTYANMTEALLTGTELSQTQLPQYG